MEMNTEVKAALDAYHARIESGLSDLNGRLDDIEKRSNRAALTGSVSTPEAERRAYWQSEEGKAFTGLLRTGRVSPELAKAWTTDQPSGAYAVPTILSQDIVRQAVSVSRLRGLARVVQSDSADYKHLVSAQNASASWTNENGTRSETNTPDLKVVAPTGGEVYAYLRASNWQVNDSAFDIADFMVENAGLQFGRAEGSAFIVGDGVNKPRGLTTYPNASTADASRPFGTVQYVPTGVSGGYHATTPGDVLFDTVAALKVEYRANASWLMNSTTLATVRKWKTAGSGDYLIRDPMTSREPPQLLGYPVEICEDMPSSAANALPIAFGNFRAAYLVLDVGDMSVITDTVTQPGFTKWYLARRVYGALLDSAAVKFVKQSAS